MNLALGIKLEVQDNHGASYVGQSMIEQYGQPQRTVGIVIKPEMPCVSIKDEISKCQVLCANCHARKTAEQFNFYSGIVK